jgi:hypothetical protein
MSITSKWFVIASLMIIPGISHAVIENIPEENGWGGFVVLGVGYTDIKSNTVAGNKLISIGNNDVDSLVGSPESDDAAHVVWGGRVTYTFGDQWQAFLGTGLIERLTLDFSQQLGIRKQTEGGQRFSVGLLFGAIPSEVWEDPYQTSDTGPRRETDRDSTGIRLEWDKILGSGANVTVDFRDLDIDKDFIGQNVTGGTGPAASCIAACQSALQRDGDSLRLEAGWAFNLSSRHVLRPAVRWFGFDADGDAQDRSGYSALLTWSLLAENFTVVVSGIYSNTDYGNPNPIYGIDQDSEGLGLSGTIFYKLSQDGRWQATSTIGYGESDSDIDFHDNEVLQFSAGVLFKFGNENNRWRNR